MKNNEIENTKINNEANSKQITTKTVQESASKKPASTQETENTIELKSKNNNKNQALQSKTSSQETVYVSSNEKAKGLIMIFLLTLSVLLNIILIWRR